MTSVFRVSEEIANRSRSDISICEGSMVFLLEDVLFILFTTGGVCKASVGVEFVFITDRFFDGSFSSSLKLGAKKKELLNFQKFQYAIDEISKILYQRSGAKCDVHAFCT